MSEAPQQTQKASWTILLYIAADGGIANFGIESLKQISRSVALSADVEGEETVVVAAQFSVDAPGGRQIPRYIFNDSSFLPLKSSERGHLDAPENMTEQQALISFLKWSLKHPDCKADNYALVLWGHGPEFLLQPPPEDPNNDRGDLYLTPEELREALQECFGTGSNLRIIGFDACSMSMLEMAYEIRDYADYMVASQEEVPDLSFPYDSLVRLFRQPQSSAKIETLLSESVDAYMDAYRDYVCTPLTGMKPATLSALRLKQSGSLVNAVESLAGALLNACQDRALPRLLVDARKVSRDYAGGLYVDMADFATNLRGELVVSKARLQLECGVSKQRAANASAVVKADELFGSIDQACSQIIAALTGESQGTPSGVVVANGTRDRQNHGVSIYFPYLTPDKIAVAEQPLVKGGRGTAGGKEFTGVVNTASDGLLMCVRREMIRATEGYYPDLQLTAKTGWYQFIQEQWSQILAENAADRLDMVYSAQQCSINLAQVYSIGYVVPKFEGPVTYDRNSKRETANR